MNGEENNIENMKDESTTLITKEESSELADLMMFNVKEFGKYSFELEEKREQSLINQSSQMLTAFSVFTAALYMLLPVLIGNITVHATKLFFCTLIISFLLLASLVLALLVQWRYKYVTMQGVEEFYNRIYQEFENYTSQAQFDIQWKEQLKQIHLSKKALNDKRVSLITASMILFFMAIGALVLSVFALIFITL